MRKTYRFNDGTVIEPYTSCGGLNGWVIIYPNGKRSDTRDTLNELRARFGKATAFDPRFNR
jgi:hypothetical protein